MRSSHYQRAVCTAALLAVLFTSSHAFLVDDDTPPPQSTSTTAFQLTATPSHVTRGITRDVTLLCEHDGKTPLAFNEISRIRVMKQTQTGWSLLAQRTPANETSILDRNVNVTGRIPGDMKDTSLEITWLLASRDTFGTYRCDVIGLDKSLNIASESTPEVKVVEQAVTSDDLLTLLLQTREEMSDLASDVTRRLDALDRGFSTMKDAALTRDDAAAWPQGVYALLQPRTGCPVDLTFMGGDASFFVFHTESSSGDKNGNSYSKAMPLSTTTMLDGKERLYTLRFCEARRAFSTRYWPRGRYCINKLHGQPCPRDFEEGAITLDAEDNNTTSDLRGNVINEFGDRVTLGFCCKNSGSVRYSMHLPNHSPFLLYRKGGTCHPVYGMSVSDETITIDTEDNNNGDSVSGVLPDIFTLNTPSKPVGFNICYYTPNLKR